MTVRHLSADLQLSIGTVGNTVHEEVEYHAKRAGCVHRLLRKIEESVFDIQRTVHRDIFL